ncbi:hypothetical protein [[Mycobacterium] holstebronense]|uniref:Uncharacterized protein n=1 Tax=[Mycobacterium] holstebronense TaxID=3064288 RepID=A0ABM9LT91_9MYCO|nr:hypothetical protein [Mycolicibacter sp. MU0102]CAJ1504242.1 hypothetical protein MU0102_002195 [Mycolicibacter sp. MU0102]
MTASTGFRPIEFEAPLAEPAPGGLEAATRWAESGADEAARWLPAGVQFEQRTHREPGSFGVWGADWCADPDDLTANDVKTGPPSSDDNPDPFVAMTVWAFDRLQQCGNLSEFDRARAIERARQTFAIRAPIAVETEFATRLLTDTATPTDVADIVTAVGHLDQALSTIGTVGLIHARVGLLAVAVDRRMAVPEPTDPGVLRTPAGHRWVFGAGYATPLGDTLIATSQTYGWRDPVQVRTATRLAETQFIAIAERSVVVGYEASIGAATIGTTP